MLAVNEPLFALAAIGCAQQNAGGNTQLNAILDRLCTQFLHESPEYATALAVSEEQAGGRYIDRLSDVSREGLQRQLDIAQAGLNELRALNREGLQALRKRGFIDQATFQEAIDNLSEDIDNRISAARSDAEFGGRIANIRFPGVRRDVQTALDERAAEVNDPGAQRISPFP